MRRETKRTDKGTVSHPDIPVSNIALIRNGQVFMKFTPNRYLTPERIEQLRQAWVNDSKYINPTIEELNSLLC